MRFIITPSVPASSELIGSSSTNSWAGFSSVVLAMRSRLLAEWIVVALSLWTTANVSPRSSSKAFNPGRSCLGTGRPLRSTVICAPAKKSPFSSVALVQAFGNETLMTAFITDTHADGRQTVFLPTGPNPTSGLIFHIPEKYVHPVGVSVEETMRSVIGCGAGSANLLNALDRNSIV